MVVKKHNPDLVGFSAFTPFANPALEAATAAKEVNPISWLYWVNHAVLAETTLKNVPIWMSSLCRAGGKWQKKMW